jgi:uncharacterized protein YjbI with pentapeptide repeats
MRADCRGRASHAVSIFAGSLIATPSPGTMADRNTGAAMAIPAIPKFPAWVRIAAVIIAAAAVLELLFAICWWWGVPGWLVIATAIALAPPLAYGAWWLWWRLPKWEVNRLALKIRDPKARADVEDNFRKTAGQLIGGAAVLIGAGFALFQFLQQQQTAQIQSLLQQKAAQDLLISNQVSKGFEQLASDKITMRLGGIYALEGVMNTSEQYHGPVVEALCAFVRENTIGKNISEKRPATDIQAALTVIGRRTEGPGELNLANISIPGADLSDANLSYPTAISGAAVLVGADLRGADLRGAKLIRAKLSGAVLSDANLSGANLFDANLIVAYLGGTNLSGADLRGANLGDASLAHTNLGDASLSAANLSRAHLIGVNLSGANLDGANLSGADLSGTNLSGAKLIGADLAGAYLGGVTELDAGMKDIGQGRILNGANLSGADLDFAKNLTQTQLDQACGNADTKLPENLTIKPCPPSDQPKAP